jgi:hypothetical protein
MNAIAPLKAFASKTPMPIQMRGGIWDHSDGSGVVGG